MGPGLWATYPHHEQASEPANPPLCIQRHGLLYYFLACCAAPCRVSVCRSISVSPLHPGAAFLCCFLPVVSFLSIREASLYLWMPKTPYMATLTPYHLRLLNARGEVMESYPAAPLAQLVPLAAARAVDFDAYQTVWRILKQTGGLYARPFASIPAPAVKGKRKPVAPTGPLIVHIVSAALFHVPEKVD